MNISNFAYEIKSHQFKWTRFFDYKLIRVHMDGDVDVVSNPNPLHNSCRTSVISSSLRSGKLTRRTLVLNALLLSLYWKIRSDVYLQMSNIFCVFSHLLLRQIKNWPYSQSSCALNEPDTADADGYFRIVRNSPAHGSKRQTNRFQSHLLVL